MEFATPEFKELLRTFNEHGVRYLIVAALPSWFTLNRAIRRTSTFGFDASPEDATRVFAALRDFGAPLEGLTQQDFTDSGFYQMGRPPGRIDVMMTLDGVEFDTAWENRKSDNFRGVPVNYVGKDDLIRNKECAGPYQDLCGY